MSLIRGDARAIPLAAETVQCVVTSPPYWGLRDYGLGPDCIGLEPTPEMYVQHMVEVFREVWRVLRTDGTLWLNLGDSYCATTKGSGGHNEKQDSNRGSWFSDRKWRIPSQLKPKDLVGIPWRVAFALQSDGWYLRSDIIWAKPNPMPESVTDRPTKSHEYIFLLAKSERYYFDADAVKEPAVTGDQRRPYTSAVARELDGRPKEQWHGGETRNGRNSLRGQGSNRDSENGRANRDGRDMSTVGVGEFRNIRTVWSIATQPYKGSHFATFPEEIPDRCILAGSKPGDLVLDPFGGSGTVGRVAERLNRRWVCMDLKYQELSAQRTTMVQKELLA